MPGVTAGAVDSEGINVGDPIVKGKGKDKKTYQKQRTVLWMAGGANDFKDQILADPNTLDRERIWEFLTCLPRQFSGPNADDAAPIFVGFGFNYDVGQLVAGLPYRKAWELHKGLPWDRRDDEDFPESFRRWVLVGGYTISHIPRKSVVLCKLRDGEKPFRWTENKKTGQKQRNVDWIERIEIYDVHGFFQSSLLKAIEKFPDAVTPTELELITEGKKARGAFTGESLDMLKRYTAAELKALVNMMENLRAGFKLIERATGQERQLEISNWWGAGAIAQVLLKNYLGKRPTHILGDMSKPWLALDAGTGIECDANDGNGEYVADAVAWVTRAYFGGRIELCKQGVHRKETYLYDVASAYPSIAVQLPSMEGGKWVRKMNPTRDEIAKSNILSMFKVRTPGFATDLPFYPLPFRTERKSIMFPPEIFGGRYMRDDVIAAFEYADRFTELKQLAHWGLYPDGPQIIVSEGLFFIPTDEASRPLTFIKDLFDWRASLHKDDMRGQVIKLGINSVYGKFAQRVGKRGEPPSYGSLWYAAAITAGTRRKLLEAALSDPSAIIAFATDAVFSTSALPLQVPETKILGEWEFEPGGVASIAQSGFYSIRKREEMLGDRPKLLKIASRGFSPNKNATEIAQDFADALDHDLFVNVPEYWRNGIDTFSFDDQTYLGLGASVVSPKTWEYIGYWKSFRREMNLNIMSEKRRVPDRSKGRKGRADRLLDLEVRPYLGPLMISESAPSVPDWMVLPGVRRAKEREWDNENVYAGIEF
jgi:hypothetical protein